LTTNRHAGASPAMEAIYGGAPPCRPQWRAGRKGRPASMTAPAQHLGQAAFIANPVLRGAVYLGVHRLILVGGLTCRSTGASVARRYRRAGKRFSGGAFPPSFERKAVCLIERLSRKPQDRVCLRRRRLGVVFFDPHRPLCPQVMSPTKPVFFWPCVIIIIAAGFLRCLWRFCLSLRPKRRVFGPLPAC